jgi:hypothetical protein
MSGAYLTDQDPSGGSVSNPFLRKIWLEVRARGGWYPILERVASGEALTKIAKDFNCSRHTMYKLLHKSEKLWDLFIEARRESAMALAEEGTDILDELENQAVVTREDIMLAKERVAQRRWLAQSYDRDTFGIQAPTGPGGTISLGALHLQVLMAPEKPKALPSGPQPRVVEAEVVSIEGPADDRAGESSNSEQAGSDPS